MELLLIVSNGLLVLLVIVIALVVLALSRQVGVLLERIAPAGDAFTAPHLAVGETAPPLMLPTLDGDTLLVGAANQSGRSTLVFFLSPTCNVCATLLPMLLGIDTDNPNAPIIVIASDGERAEHIAFRARKQLNGLPYVLSPIIGMTYQIANVPAAVLIDSKGIIRAQTVIDDRAQLAALLDESSLYAA